MQLANCEVSKHRDDSDDSDDRLGVLRKGPSR